MPGLGEVVVLVLRTLSHFGLIMIPSFAFATFAAWRGARDPVLLGLTALVGIALPSYTAFWLWFFSPRVGHAFSFLLPVLGIAWLIWLYPKLQPTPRAVLIHLLFPSALVLSSSLLVLSAGFLYGGIDKPLQTPWTRFSHRLPPDNMLPYILAEEVRIGRISNPILEDWHSSDRPPLQTAITLAQYPFVPRPRELGYTAIGVILQSLWIYALWLLLTAFRLDPRLIVLVLITTLLSGFIFLNSFFVWPKLLAAAFIIGFLTLLLDDRLFTEMAGNVGLLMLAGALLSFGMLAHGGSAFALIGAFFTAVAVRRRLSFRSVGIIIATAFAIYLPWLLYQRFFDPPGDHLLKLHLAGVELPDNRSLTESLVTAYRSLTFRDLMHSKGANILFVIGHERDYWSCASQLFIALSHGDGTRAAAAANCLRIFSFFHFLPNLGFLFLGLVALLAGVQKRFRSSEWRLAVRLLLYVLFTLVFWCLIMFRPGSTSIPAGTYVTLVLAFSASILALWAVAPSLAITVAMLQATMNFLVYGVYLQRSADTAASRASPLQYGELALFVLALLCTLLILRSQWRNRSHS